MKAMIGSVWRRRIGLLVAAVGTLLCVWAGWSLWSAAGTRIAVKRCHMLVAKEQWRQKVRGEIVLFGGPQAAVRRLSSYAVGGDPLELRRTAVSMLGECGPGALPTLSRLASNGRREEGLRNSATMTMGQLGAVAVEPLSGLLADEGICLAAQLALAEIGAPAVPAMEQALQSHSSRVRHRAANVLGGIGERRSVAPLLGLLQDSDEDVRVAAIQALGRIGDPRAIEALTAKCSDQDWMTRDAAKDALRLIREKESGGPPRRPE